MRRRFADAACERLEALADGYDERAGEGGHVDPFAAEVLGLQTAVRGRLQEVAGEHAVFVGADALALGARGGGQGVDGGVFDDLELVLLVGVEEAGECGGGEQ